MLNSRHLPLGPFACPPAPERFPPAALEEVLVADARAYLTPADMLERKFLYRLNGSAPGGRPLRTVVPGEYGRGKG
jgi:hypothetical protein